MNYDRFIGKVQSLAHLPTREAAVTACRATLQTLAERLTPDACQHLAAQLPREIGVFLVNERIHQEERYSLPEFLYTVAIRESHAFWIAAGHARAVLAVVGEALSPGSLRNALAQLPAEFHELFAPAPAGGEPAPA